jgi:HEAT repeat protein
MRVIDTMCSLIASASETISGDAEAEDLFRLLVKDRDESVRWAIVLFLAEYGGDRCSPDLRFDLYSQLSEDAHFWVRREVALALGRINEPSVRTAGLELLSRMRKVEPTREEACTDEVLHFVELSIASLSRGETVLPRH